MSGPTTLFSKCSIKSAIIVSRVAIFELFASEPSAILRNVAAKFDPACPEIGMSFMYYPYHLPVQQVCAAWLKMISTANA